MASSSVIPSSADSRRLPSLDATNCLTPCLTFSISAKVVSPMAALVSKVARLPGRLPKVNEGDRCSLLWGNGGKTPAAAEPWEEMELQRLMLNGIC